MLTLPKFFNSEDRQFALDLLKASDVILISPDLSNVELCRHHKERFAYNISGDLKSLISLELVDMQKTLAFHSE